MREQLKTTTQAQTKHQEQQDEKINRLLSLLVKEGIEGKTVFGKKTFEYLKNEEDARLCFETTDCDNDPIFFDAAAKDLLPVKEALEK